MERRPQVKSTDFIPEYCKLVSEDMTYSEIAEKMGMTKGSLVMRVNQMNTHFKKLGSTKRLPSPKREQGSGRNKLDWDVLAGLIPD